MLLYLTILRIYATMYLSDSKEYIINMKFPTPKNDKERSDLAMYIYKQREKRAAAHPKSGVETGVGVNFQAILLAEKFVDDLTDYFKFFDNQNG